RERLAGCVSFIVGEDKWGKFPDVTFERTTSHFWSRLAYLKLEFPFITAFSVHKYATIFSYINKDKQKI
ncbi:hypothetical protein, partial [Enterococcus faecalis]|uniref:hypothetical protein n=1 Tax=Enterococcus faecalis TaxID=1351 RepID=UPI003D6A5258